MIKRAFLMLAFASAAVLSAAAADTQTVKGMVTALMDDTPEKHTFVLQSGNKRQLVIDFGERTPRPGDLVTIVGRPLNDNESFLTATRVTVTGHRTPPAAERATPVQISNGEKDLRAVRLSGVVIDAFVDEIDNRWYYLVIRAGGNDVYAAMRVDAAGKDEILRLVDSEIELTGVASNADAGRRKLLGSIVHIASLGDIRMINASPDNPFDRPELTDEDLEKKSPEELRDLGRKSVAGDVLAAWNGDRFLLRRDDGNVLTVELTQGETLPACGDRVQAVGLAETDLYRVNLANARLRVCGRASGTNDAPVSVRPEDVLTDKNGNPRIWTEYFGKLLLIEGVVRSLPAPGTASGRFYLECGHFLVPVDVSSAPQTVDALSVGAKIAVTGVCLLETENWRPSVPFPRIRGMALIVRSPADVTVLSQPPWWTPGRLLAALASLLAVIIGFAIWNRILQRAVERRSRQLLKSEIAKVSSDLRVDERTRLAVELHDSVAQMLTGVSMQLDASARARTDDPASADNFLVTAQRMLKSCLTELRRCLWDLRSECLEEPDFQEAVRKTLVPALGGAELSLRMELKRSRLSDATAHALLRIIRELAGNAVRHGQATKVRVAGAMEGKQILVSVRDNGCGFDAHAAPGPGEGHFGLDGIRERIRPFDGTFEIKSTPGKGTNVRIVLNVK